LLAPKPNPHAGGPPLVCCPRLLIQYIHSYFPHRRPFLHPQPEDAPCRCDRNPLTTWFFFLIFCCFIHVVLSLCPFLMCFRRWPSNVAQNDLCFGTALSNIAQVQQSLGRRDVRGTNCKIQLSGEHGAFEGVCLLYQHKGALEWSGTE
jgi:hypothetical protein